MPNCGGVNFQIWSLFTPNQFKLQVFLILKAFNKRANLLKEDVLNRTVILPQGYLQTNFNDFFFQLRLWTTFIKVRTKYFYSEILLSSVRRFFFWSLGQMTSISSREYWYCRKHWQLPMVFFLRLIQFHFMCHFQTVSTLSSQQQSSYFYFLQCQVSLALSQQKLTNGICIVRYIYHNKRCQLFALEWEVTLNIFGRQLDMKQWRKALLKSNFDSNRRLN